MERKVDFVACDMPSANAFMINVYAAVAQEERRMISGRAKAGLRAAKERGVVLGGPARRRRQSIALARRLLLAVQRLLHRYLLSWLAYRHMP
jgi:DNA invertase Pin-like site-specific DNA recombinase